jgi:biopolymer transport protein ExbD
MRIPTVVRRREMRVNMTPMIDVVFLLIIFFLVSSQLARQESQMPLALPAADSGETLVETERPRVIVNVTAQGELLLVGRKVSPDELQRRLRNERERAGADLEVRIRSDRQVAYRFVQPILTAVSKSGISNVTFAVVKRESQ